jgi:signal peptidase I
MIDPQKLQRVLSIPRWLWRETRAVFYFLVLMVIFRSAIADWSDVPTGSMKPTIVEGDRIFVNKLAYDLRIPLTHRSLWQLNDPRRGDIIIFDSTVSNLRLVKRVIGLPGDLVEIRQEAVLINGEALEYTTLDLTASSIDMHESVSSSALNDLSMREHTVRISRLGGLANFGPVRVPDNAYFALGDNRDNSADSRVIGFIPREEIVGRSSAVVFSLDYDNYYLPRVERFFKSL